MRSHAPRTVAALAVVLVSGSLVAGCGEAASTSPVASVAPPSAVVPTEVPTTTASPPPFSCGEPVTRPGTVALAYLDDLAAANEGGATGRVTFTFRPAGASAALPEVEVAPATPPFLADPSGMPLEVPGSGFVVVTLHGGTALDADYEPTFEGPFDVDLEGGPIVALRRAGDFEGVSTWIVGLTGSPCARILPPDGTSRIVVELEVEQP